MKIKISASASLEFQKFELERVVNTETEELKQEMAKLNDLAIMGLRDLVNKKRALRNELKLN